jgi:hypothetical protein
MVAVAPAVRKKPSSKLPPFDTTVWPPEMADWKEKQRTVMVRTSGVVEAMDGDKRRRGAGVHW